MTTNDTTDLAERLLAFAASDDHERGCEGRQYSCTCGYDDRVEQACDEAQSSLREAAATITRLRAENELQVMALEDRAERSEHRYRHTRQWNAERWERITAYAKEHGFWDDIACIMANGTLNVRKGRAYDPPTYAQQMNAAIHRAEAAEDRASKLRGLADDMAEVLHECTAVLTANDCASVSKVLIAYRTAFPEPHPLTQGAKR